MAIRSRLEESPTGAVHVPSEPDDAKGTRRHSMLQKLPKWLSHKWLSKDESLGRTSYGPQVVNEQETAIIPTPSSKRIDIGLSRQPTFRRQKSERRDRLEPVEPSPFERRAHSATPQRPPSIEQRRSKSSPAPAFPGRVSAPTIAQSNGLYEAPQDSHVPQPREESTTSFTTPEDLDHVYPKLRRSPSWTSDDSDQPPDGDERAQLDLELDSKWILNLSMHFRDKSDREKFFVTFADTPTRWRRVTVSCDYRHAEPASLEMDLKELQYQRDKSIQIYESIRDSLPEIQFYDTVTNLKIETNQGRLHVHVSEDVNEVIPYPPITSVSHILNDPASPSREIRESELVFDSHLSGFVYKVTYGGKEYIKKEIPGPDTVDEFLYEINALHALTGSTSVISLEAVIVDEARQIVKGLLISFAERGALVDLLYDHKGEIPWEDRMRWARQAIQGLNEIHEEGYVQGDFTLSNIVVDRDNNAMIIDINRRGCPVGWEPPELAKKIASNQRISMYIGQKSDLFQLGMSLWALAMEEDEPERHDPPLSVDGFPESVPRWFRKIVQSCLQPQPRDRLSAKELLHMFPPGPRTRCKRPLEPRDSESCRSDKRYIEPSAAVEREDIERLGSHQAICGINGRSGSTTAGDETFDAPSSSYQFDSGSSYIGIGRGRRPHTHPAPLQGNQYPYQRSTDDEIDFLDESDVEPHIIDITPDVDQQYDGIQLGGNPCFVSQSSFEPDHLRAPATAPCEKFEPDFTQDEPTPPVDARLSSEGITMSTSGASLLSPGSDNALDFEQSHNLVPPPLRPSSIISSSTPRNAASILTTSAPSTTQPPPLDLSAVDLAGFGGHPTLDEHSLHEPARIPDLSLALDDQDQDLHYCLPSLNTDESRLHSSPSTHDDDKNGLTDSLHTPNSPDQLLHNLIGIAPSEISQHFDTPTDRPSAPNMPNERVESEKQPQPSTQLL